MTILKTMAFGPAEKGRIEAGDQQALLRGLACTAALWFQIGGSDMQFRSSMGCARFASGRPTDAILAAACDLYDLLSLSPQGREALLHFRDKPVLEQAKGE